VPWKMFSVLKDVALTGLGMVAIYTQIFSAKPNGLILGTGLALTVPSVAEHVKALLPGSGGGPSSPSSESPGRPSPSGGQRGE
jgi:hypothetical protein